MLLASLNRIAKQAFALLNRLIEPTDTVSNTSERIRLRLLATLFLGSAIAVSTILPVRYWGDAGLPNSAYMGGVSLLSGLLMLIPYRLAVKGNAPWANRLMMAITTCLIFGLSVDPNIVIVTRTMNYLLLLVLFTSHFTSVPFTLGLAAVQAVFMVLVLRQHEMPFRDILIGPLAFHVSATLIMAVFAYYRERIERERQAELTQSESLYRKVSELNPNYSYSFRIAPGGGLIKEWMTDTFSEITGYDWEEINKIGILPLYHPDDRQRQADDLALVYRGMPASGEYRIITKQGQVRWMHISRHPQMDAEGKLVVGYYGMAQDVTARKVAEEREIKAVLQRERLVLMNDFVQAISHDFRTSLATIETSRYLLQRGLSEPDRDKAQSRLNVIQQFVFHMEEQLENLRTITALANLSLQGCDLNALVSSILDEQTVKSRQRGHQIVFQPDRDLPMVRADSQELGRAIKHVVINALNYMSSNGVVTIRSFASHERVGLEVQDTGIGIAPEHLKHIFDLFYRVEAARPLDSGGVGLGLSIVRTILEAHGGTVEVSSVVNEGSIFTLYLPLSPVE